VVDQFPFAQGIARNMRAVGRPARPRLLFYAPSRGLIGYPRQFLTDTRAPAFMNHFSTNTAPIAALAAAQPAR